MIPTTCAVALPIPALKPYSYSIPASLADRVKPGARVLVPVRSRELIGVVLAVDEESPGGLKPVLLAPDAEPLLPQPLLDLGVWVSGYYTTPIGLTFRAMLPSALWGASRLMANVVDARSASGGTSRDVMSLIRRAGGRVPAASLTRKLGRPVWDTLQRLERAGAVALETEPAKLGPVPRKEDFLVLERTIPSLLERDRVFGRAARQRSAFDAVDELGGDQRVSS